MCAFLTLTLAATALTACASIENGYYENGQSAPPPATSPVTTTTEPTTPPSSVPPQSSEETTSSPEVSQVPESVSHVSDAVEELVTKGNWDYSTLSNEGDGWGQGTRFDDLNRPKSAVRFNESYSLYNAKAIDLTEDKVITLTFDQGYENGFTGMILDTLKDKGVKATFFLTGDYARRQPELIQRMIDEGHTIGSHSWSHYSMPEISIEEMQSEIMTLHEYVLENYGVCMTLFRPGKGEYSELSLAVTADFGYTSVFWSFAYADWDTDNQPDPTASLEKLVERLHPGAIYLLHSVSETNATILGDFIDRALAEGYTFK
ncbi:MAG: polysaccharide deacetylase family protein [Oscillospiraceae bacterium]|nr:polysaccharide deacetylase family protein [Oscillospiraceae bacterium]